ncbi:hypothetical protein GCM10008171_14240 [Methylopila jiangsuensis]|uniref:Uncharacterized protein n=1 Tax=Methylopila jiangsuensis TaxID=586230 RepID=A0A9W6JEL1_9HYPH|nr:hypothetical protein [Methylopila jiangsuensis]MDR6284312.1 hypothetical protein [Methylopila jiangsuensis]GLK76170.1 hypothetical protein GCM10008171_14240 [Methylopila jiangsuensis]
MTLFNTEIYDVLIEVGIPDDKAMAVAVALTPPPPSSAHQPVVGNFAIYHAMRALGVDDKARACAIALKPQTR